MAPQKPEPPNWLQRVFRRRTQTSSDQIAVQIGERAQHVVVGKNIIQIGSVQLSRRTVVVMLVGVLVLVGIGIKIAIDNQRTAQSSQRTAENSQQIAQRLNATATPTPTFTLTPTATPTATPSPTPTLFPPAGKDETLVVVADFLDPTKVDMRDVTTDLVDQMRATLKPYANIRVERLRRAIPRDNGSATAMQIGEDLAISATLVIWGYYVSPPDPELTVHFDIVRKLSTYLPTTSTDRFGPTNIQPSMFDFKVNLGNELGQLVAFAAGVTLFNSRQYKAAEPLFTIASPVISHTIAADFAQAMHYYRGTNYWYLGRFREAQPDLVAALPAIPPTDLHTDDLYLALLNNIGGVYDNLGERQKALDYYNQALPLRRQVGDKAGEAITLNNIGVVYDNLGERQKALDYYNQALPLRRQVGDKAGEATTLNNIGGVYDGLGERQKALDYYNQALPLRRQVGDKAGEAVTLGNIGLVYANLGEWQKALDYYNQALPLQRQVGDKASEAVTLSSIGAVYGKLGERQKALDYYNQALPLLQQVGDKADAAVTLSSIGVVYADVGERQKALDYFNQALPLLQQVGDKASEAKTLYNIGAFYANLGERQKALDYYNQALPLLQQVGDRWTESITRYNIAMTYKAVGDLVHAEEQLVLVVALDEALGKPSLTHDRAMLEKVRTERKQAEGKQK